MVQFHSSACGCQFFIEETILFPGDIVSCFVKYYLTTELRVFCSVLLVQVSVCANSALSWWSQLHSKVWNLALLCTGHWFSFSIFLCLFGRFSDSIQILRLIVPTLWKSSWYFHRDWIERVNCHFLHIYSFSFFNIFFLPIDQHRVPLGSGRI